MASLLQFERVYKSYPDQRGGEYMVLEGFDLTIEKEEFVSLIGHSGCGKSTALMMAAGLTDIPQGYVFLKSEEVVGPGPDRGVVFQHPSLLPWLSALENVMLGVNAVYSYASKKQREDVAKFYLNRVGLFESMNQRASELSTGMKQRVAIARAFALKPKVLLLDEPFGMLDSMTRGELQEVLMEVWSKEKITALLVTHDIDEALFLSDRVVMMTNGPRARVGDILKVNFERPRHRKDVIDHPDYYEYRGYLMNFLEGRPTKASVPTGEEQKDLISV
ncbi:MAG TPA: ABC transporter ATP-binding protein [Candidatus Omnitrophota bacterium]|nr:ABC transporter ATP-binding protein [Candidatus Omnitrophota bacterium]